MRSLYVSIQEPYLLRFAVSFIAKRQCLYLHSAEFVRDVELELVSTLMKPEDPRDIPENFSHMVGNGELVQDDAVVSRLERRIGSLDGQFLIPDDFDEMYAEEILDLFENGDRSMPEETTDSGTET